MNFSFSDRITKIPPYAFAEVEKKVEALKSQGVKVIDFGVGDPRDPTPDFILDRMTEFARNHATDGYPSYIGSENFRREAGAYLSREFGVTLDPKTQITSTIGAKEAVFHFPLAFVNPGDIVLCPTPGYPPYKTGTIFAGGTPYFLPLLEENNFLIDFESVPEDICKKAKIIWTNYPNSPTGALAPREWLEKLVAWARKYNIIIAADEGCYIDIYFDEKPVSILEVTTEGVIAFYSLSKRNNMTGFRAGFCAGDAALIEGLRRVKTNIDSGTQWFVQDAAIAALQNTTHVEKMRQGYRKKKEILQNALRRFGLPDCQSQATFYLWQRAPQGMTGAELSDKFLSLGIVVTPGSWLSDTDAKGVNPGTDFVRFALVPTIEEVEEAAERLSRPL